MTYVSFKRKQQKQQKKHIIGIKCIHKEQACEAKFKLIKVEKIQLIINCFSQSVPNYYDYLELI